jgi:hypothetical protein
MAKFVRRSKREGNRLIKLVETFPFLSFWNLALGVGGLFLFMYFVSIEFVPDFDLKDFLGLIGASAFLGLLLLLVFGGSLILPAFLIPVRKHRKDRFIWQQFFELTAGIALAVFGVLLTMQHFKISAFGITRITELALLASVFLLGAAWNSRQFRITFTRNKRLYAHTVFWRLARPIAWGFWGILFVGLLTLMLDQNQFPKDEPLFLYAITVIPVIFGVGSFITAKATKEHGLQALGFGALVASLLFGVIIQKPNWFSPVIMRGLGVTISTPVRLVVSPAGCLVVNQILPKRCTLDSKEISGLIENVFLVSRVGTQHVLHFPGIQQDTQVAATPAMRNLATTRIVIRSSEIHGFAQMKP